MLNESEQVEAEVDGRQHPAIEVRNISKTFVVPHDQAVTFKRMLLQPGRHRVNEEIDALVDVTFDIHRGEFFGVIGPNGSGKSTLLKVIAGIYQANGGEVTLRGQISPFIELGVGFHPELTARDNIFVNGTLLGLTDTEIEARLDDILQFAELERYVDQKLGNFSSGMQVRLAYSIAIQVPFDLLLLDEVLAVGDRAFQRKCHETFANFRAEGKTVVLVTHDLNSVTEYCDRALFLDNGVVQEIGPSAEVVNHYIEFGAEGLKGQVMPSELTFLEGWHGLEYDNDAQPFRWMSTRANLTLEWSDDERPSLTIAAEVVSFGVTRQLVVESDGKVLAELTIPPHGLIDLVFDLPAGTGPIDLAFRVDPPAQAASIVTAHDRRRLAVAFWNVRIDAPYGAHLVRPA